MGLISSKLRSVSQGEHKAVTYHCPGCDRAHLVWYKAPVAWDWNGDAEKPTFTPSIRIYQPATKDRPEVTECHCFVRDGRIQFLDDCAHELAGQDVPMPDWPHARGAYGGIEEPAEDA